MWIVCTRDEGIYGIYANREEAEKDYEALKRIYEQQDDVLNDTRVVMAKIEKHFYTYDTGKKYIQVDENGNEIEHDDITYWEFKEDVYGY